MATQTFFDPYPVKVNQNSCIYLPAKFLEWINAQENTELHIQCAVGKHGQFIYLVNPAQQKEWVKEQKKKGA